MEFTAKLVIIANNCPALKKSEIEYYAMLSKTGVHQYAGSKYPFFFPKSFFLKKCFGNSFMNISSSSSSHTQNKDNIDLGTACGKFFRVSVMSITDPGDSDIIRSSGQE